MSAPKFEIKTDGVKTEITMDGNPLKGVREIKFDLKAQEVPILQVDFIATNMTLDASVIPTLPEMYKGFYEPVEQK